MVGRTSGLVGVFTIVSVISLPNGTMTWQTTVRGRSNAQDQTSLGRRGEVLGYRVTFLQAALPAPPRGSEICSACPTTDSRSVHLANRFSAPQIINLFARCAFDGVAKRCLGSLTDAVSMDCLINIIAGEESRRERPSYELDRDVRRTTAAIHTAPRWDWCD
jgi:hypothetical protein